MPESLQLPLSIAGLFFPVIFIAFWCFVLGLISKFGGWGQLASRYSYDGSFLGGWKRFQWGQIGGLTQYKSSLWVGVAADGLYLKTGPLFLFRPYHPPLRIPWTSITAVQSRKHFWLDVVDISIGDPTIKLTLQKGALSGAERFLPGLARLEQRDDGGI